VVAAAEATLNRDKSVSAIDVLGGIGWLPWSTVDSWRQGRVDHLEQGLSVQPDKVAAALKAFRGWAERRGLEPSEVAYVARTRDRRAPRFSADGDPAVERAYRTHWISPELSKTKRERLTQRQSRAPDLVVVMPRGDWSCTSCGGTGAFLFMEGPGPLCLTCADMDHLVFLPRGDATLSRRAKKESGLSAVVVRFSRTRKRYERQGILVEEAALERAEEQCLADEDVRERRRERARERRGDEDLELQSRMAKEIRRLYPGCPVERAEAIARRAGARGSGRVGRTAAGRALDEDAIKGAVVASVRHEETGYDTLVMAGITRMDARERVRHDIDAVLDAWRGSR
jgi:hypothetical protein